MRAILLSKLDALTEDELLKHHQALRRKLADAQRRLEFDTAGEIKGYIADVLNELADRKSGYPSDIVSVKPATVKGKFCVCGLPVKALGLCAKHHQKYTRTGYIPVNIEGKIAFVSKEPNDEPHRKRFSLIEYL